MPKPTKTTTPRKRTTPAKRRAKPAAKSAAESVAAPQLTAKPRPSAPTKFRLKIFGTGGAGVNVINHISAAREQDGQLLSGAELIAVNTDVQSLAHLPAAQQLQIGASLTRGLGSGGDPELGARAARVDLDRIEHAVGQADAVFIVAGLGGGTGGGAAPILARLARKRGALVIGFVTLPFGFEGAHRRDLAITCLEELQAHADVVICVANDRLLKLTEDNASALEVFKKSDEMITSGAQAIWQLMSRRGLINLDFASLRSMLQDRHAEGVFARGEGEGPKRVADAVRQLLEHPLLDEDHALARTEGVLISILGGPDLTLAQVQQAVDPITRAAQRANIMIGAAVDENYQGRFSVTVIAAANVLERKPISRKPVQPETEPTPAPAPSAPASASAKADETSETTEDAADAEAAGAVLQESSAPRQQVLALNHVSRGRFDQSEPTIHEGQDLDVPTFLRQETAIQ